MEKMRIKACCVSVDNESSVRTLGLARQSPPVLPFVGIHPQMAADILESMEQKIRQSHRILSGIGEIGLDPSYADSDADRDRQALVFEMMLLLAEKYRKPVSIHSRKPLDAICGVLPSYSLRGKLLHWFDGSKRQLRQAMDLDCYVSFGPVTVYAGDRQALLRRADPARVLVETDGPVPFSRCFEHKPAQISLIQSVIFCASIVSQNSQFAHT